MFADNKVVLKEGQLFSFDLKDIPGNQERVRLPHPEILNTLRVGDTLLLDDGKLRMVVVKTTMNDASDTIPTGTTTNIIPTSTIPTSSSNNLLEEDRSVTCQVIVGGVLSNRKGVNTPSVVLPISPLTAKDRKYVQIIPSVTINLYMLVYCMYRIYIYIYIYIYVSCIYFVYISIFNMQPLSYCILTTFAPTETWHSSSPSMAWWTGWR